MGGADFFVEMAWIGMYLWGGAISVRANAKTRH
jgi:hypothetical protein